ncbi:hypothetical protein GCM10027155_18160 [Acinetobacter apis]
MGEYLIIELQRSVSLDGVNLSTPCTNLLTSCMQLRDYIFHIRLWLQYMLTFTYTGVFILRNQLNSPE